VAGLGKAAYRLVRSPSAGAGSTVEIGWLSGTGRLMVLRRRFPPAAATS
jgi:hypothetical protein